MQLMQVNYVPKHAHREYLSMYTHNDIKLGIDINNSIFSIDNRQSRDSSSNKQADGSDERSFWCRLSKYYASHKRCLCQWHIAMNIHVVAMDSRQHLLDLH